MDGVRKGGEKKVRRGKGKKMQKRFGKLLWRMGGFKCGKRHIAGDVERH